MYKIYLHSIPRSQCIIEHILFIKNNTYKLSVCKDHQRVFGQSQDPVRCCPPNGALSTYPAALWQDWGTVYMSSYLKVQVSSYSLPRSPHSPHPISTLCSFTSQNSSLHHHLQNLPNNCILIILSHKKWIDFSVYHS